MGIRKLDHVNIRTTQLDTLIDWYRDVLGLQTGDRPKFPFPGAWMYADNSAVVHLVGITGNAGVGSEAELKLEHFALSATGCAGFEKKLQALEVPYRRADVPGCNMVQINLWDPDGNHIHIDFAADQ